MIPNIKQTTIRASLDGLADQLNEALKTAGFQVCGITDLQKEHSELLNVHHGKYKVFLVDFPVISLQMLALHPREETILPSCVSLIERYPGEVNVSIANPTELLASLAGDGKFASLAARFTDLLEKEIEELKSSTTWAPDLVTSWE